VTTSGGSSTETTLEKTTTTGAAAAVDALLTLDDMPTGWTTAPELLEDQEDAGECTFNLDLPEDDSARAAFKEGDLGPFVLSSVGRFVNADAAAGYVDEIQAFIDRCQSSTEDGVATALSPLSFPALGDESLAFRITIDDPEAVPVEGNVVVIRRGEAASLVGLLTTFSSPDAALTEELAVAAADRL